MERINQQAGDGAVQVGSVGGNLYLSAAPTPQAPPALHQVEPSPPDFVGRQAVIDEVLTAVAAGQSQIIGLFGPAGSGKTTLAKELVQLLKEQFPDAQLVLDMRGVSAQPLTTVEALQHVFRSYYPGAQIPDDEVALRSIYQSCLKDSRAIILLDDARDADQVRALIPPAPCMLIVTGRTRFTLPGMLTQTVGTLPPDEARQLLLHVAPRAADQAEEIAALCGYLPLALRVAAGAIAVHYDLPVSEYVRRLRRSSDRLGLAGPSIQLSYDLLTEEMRRSWRLLSVFASAFTLEATSAVWNVDRERAQEQLSDLVLRNLVEWDASGAQFRLHELARLSATHAASAEEATEAARRHLQYLVDWAASLEHEDHRAIIDDHENIRTALHFSITSGTDLLTGLALLLNLKPFWEMGGHCSEGRFWLNEALKRASQCPRPVLGQAWICAGDLARAQSDYVAAIAAYEKALAQYDATEVSPATTTIRTHIGIVAAEMGNYSGAKKYFLDSLAARRTLGDLDGQAHALTLLSTLESEFHNFAEGVARAEAALAIYRSIDEPFGLANAYSTLGSALLANEDTERAIGVLSEALDRHRAMGNRMGMAACLDNLGFASGKRSDFEAALRFHREALRILLEDGDRRGVAIALSLLAEVPKAQGLWARARVILEHCLLLRRGLGNLKKMLHTAREIADLQPVDTMEDRLEAESWVADLLGDQPLASDEERTRAVLVGGALLHAAGDDETAQLLLGNQLTELRRYERPELLVETIRELASLLSARAEYEDARGLYAEALSILRELGDGRSLPTALRDLAETTYECGDTDGAIRIYREALTIAEGSSNRNEVFLVSLNLGYTLIRARRYKEAVEASAAALAIARLDKAAQRILSALLNLGTARLGVGDRARAKRSLRGAVARARTAGDERVLAVALLYLGHAVDANERRRVYQEALDIWHRLDREAGDHEWLGQLAGHAMREEDWTRAAIISAAAYQLGESLGVALTPGQRLQRVRDADELISGLGKNRYNRLCAKGTAMTVAEAVAYGFDEPERGAEAMSKQRHRKSIAKPKSG